MTRFRQAAQVAAVTAGNPDVARIGERDVHCAQGGIAQQRRDALGEFLNIVMGYVVKDVLPMDASVLA